MKFVILLILAMLSNHVHADNRHDWIVPFIVGTTVGVIATRPQETVIIQQAPRYDTYPPRQFYQYQQPPRIYSSPERLSMYCQPSISRVCDDYTCVICR